MSLAIAAGHRVTIHFRLTLDDGSVVDDSFGKDPVAYNHGDGSFLPGIDQQLTGTTAGDEREWTVAPADGYGEYDPTAERSVPRSQLPADLDVQPGMSLEAQTPRGPVTVWVVRAAGDDVTLSTNHPLAGQRLNFRVQVVDVQKATAPSTKPGSG